MINQFQHLKGVPVSPEEFDAFGHYINCQNGIINLRNGKLLPHYPALMMSKICYTDYDLDREKPVKWLKFLDDLTAMSSHL